MPERDPGDRLIAAGTAVSAVGMLLALVALLPLLADVTLPSAWWGLSMLVGIGMAMVLLGLARKGRRRARAQTRARTR